MLLRSQTDERLVALTRDGHDQAFVAIAERYRRELMAHARRLAPTDRCEDIVQQTMLSAWDALRRRADVRDVRAWLHRIVHNVAARTTAGNVDQEQLSESIAAAASTEAEVERRLAAREALAALAALPQSQRRAFELTAIEGRSGREAASELAMSEGALRQLVHRARATLRSAATALMPMPLITWAAGGTNETVAGRIGEIGAGAGIAAAVTKVGTTVAVTATLIGGATQVVTRGPGHTAPRDQGAAHHATSRGGAGAVTGTSNHIEASAVRPPTPLGRPRNGRRASGQAQQQRGSAGASGGHGQSRQTGADQRATGSASAGSGAPGSSGDGGASQSTAAHTNQGGVASQNMGASGTHSTGAPGPTGASGANQP
jgi:RNA polymerase sigma factor (sigma-70 family)